MNGAAPILEIETLVTAFQTDAGLLTAVDGVSLSVARGKTLGIVGESGCGKSVTAFSITRLLPQPHGKILGGSIRFEGRDLTALPVEEMQKVRGSEISMIFQEPMTALNPVQTVGKQLGEAILLHHQCSKSEALARSLEMMKKVRIPAPETRIHEFPHQLSGGMRQRVMIAMALINNPQLLIADEPTTALDVTVQAQILELIRDMQQELGMSVILITHDLGVIAETCDEVVVMYAGRIVERAPVHELFANPRHAYTRGLLASIPRLDSTPKTKLPAIPGNVPSIESLRPGCRFADRSGREHTAAQLNTRPAFIEIAPGHWVEGCGACVVSELASECVPNRIQPTRKNHDHEPVRIEESAFESALRHLRSSEGAGGASSGGASRESECKRQFQLLKTWAQACGKLIPADTLQCPVALGAEHRVFFDEKRRLAIKATNTGCCGMAYPNGEPAPALPSEYLQRWIWQNSLFGDCAEFEGVLENPAGLCLIVSQPWITGDVPPDEAIQAYLAANGFAMTELHESHYRATDGLAVMDCHDGNFLLAGDGMILPIDVIVVRADDGLKQRMGVVS